VLTTHELSTHSQKLLHVTSHVDAYYLVKVVNKHNKSRHIYSWLGV